ncbi:Lipoprotein-releasing system transmembrane protein lolC [Fibrella aestuarina BUZ 2]|uniref:Lipoprotein-releasing system transmembrane protein lolC n=1 Tax=Fibrella aestuarina BUZ 2 TaxID=1166018 RepID=I0KBQ6_9BACT|nr:ABC transporter permease [Fibrella aestuarina]CCH01559.1 Lipoprotein-releasing system transmembrane protein lolC [Fibrella aestuarina BUZ 2]
MTLPFFIARRYFFSRRKRSFISYLSILAMLGVGVGTMALVVVLSVFNGMEELNRQIFKSFESDLSVLPTTGKRFTMPASTIVKLRRVPGVQLLTTVAADNALARYADGQTVVRIKGVDSTYLQRHQLDSILVEGRLVLRQNGYNFAIIAEGVRNELTISPEDILTPLELFYPERGKRLSSLSPESFRQQQLGVSGVFFIEAANYNDLVLIPLAAARELLGYGPDDYSSLEMQLTPDADEQAVKEAIQEQLPQSLVVSTRDELNRDLFRAISYEKIFVSITLAFIILIASINTFFSLSMLALEKKQDIVIMSAMGAAPSLIRRIFLTEGAIISLTGAVVGLALGLLLCYLQETYGLVGFGTPSSIVSAYPVRVRSEDIVLTGAVVIFVTFLISYFPAQRAAQQIGVKQN